MIVMACGGGDAALDGVADYTERLVQALRESGERVEPVRVGRSPAGVLRAAAEIRRLRPDVVHVQFAPSAFGGSPWPGLLPALVDVPLVTTVHEYGERAVPAGVPGRVWEVLERRGLDRETWRLVPAAREVLTTNPAHARVLRERLHRESRHVPLAPNVTDHGPVDRAEVRRRLGVPADAEVVAFFGFVHPVKGLRHLVDAGAQLRGEGHDRLHLLVAGGFTSRALPADEAEAFRRELQAHVDAAGMGPHVTFTGHLPAPEVSAALHAADVAAFPFTAGTTTKSGAVLSAFAHALPTVVTGAEPPDPQLVDGETVAVARGVRDPVALADALRRVLTDHGVRRRLAAGGQRIADARTWSRIAAAHREVYARLRTGAAVRA